MEWKSSTKKKVQNKKRKYFLVVIMTMNEHERSFFLEDGVVINPVDAFRNLSSGFQDEGL